MRWARMVAAITAAVLFFAGEARGSVSSAIAGRAERLVGHRSLREIAPRYPDDCSGLARYLYSTAGIELLPPGDAAQGSAAAAIYRRMNRAGRVRRHSARPGDLVFFRDTHGPRRGVITHVGVVSRVGRDGGVSFVHRTHAGIVRSRLDLRHPRLYRDHGGRVRNDMLRRGRIGRGGAVTGELLVGFAAPPVRRLAFAR